MFPLATTPADLPVFVQWLLRNHRRFGVGASDVIDFANRMARDPSCGIEALYRRYAAWQSAVPNALTIKD